MAQEKYVLKVAIINVISILKASLLIDNTYKKITIMTSCNPNIQYKIYKDYDILYE